MSGFSDLVRITDAVYQADLARMRDISREEADLRAEIQRLNHEVRRAEDLAPDAAHAHRSIGADVMWKAWVGRSRETLNMRLAAVVARKLQAAEALKHSLGRKSVAQDLSKRADRARYGTRASRALADEQDQMIVQAYRERQNLQR